MASISFSRSLPRRADKASFEAPSAFDLFHQLIYMSAVASAGISRSRIFQLAAKSARAPAEYFKRIHLLCERLGYSYPAACNIVGEKAKSEAMRTFLLRFADALSSGHPEVSFLTEEAQVQREVYEKEYDRNMASLTKWTDAYGAIVVSSALIVIVNLTSTMIYDLAISMIAGLVFTAVLGSAGGAWVISRAAPSAPEAFFSPEGPRLQRLALTLARVTPVAVLAICLSLALLGVALGWLLVVAGLLMAPLGITAMRAIREVERKDKEIGPFLRSFGAVAMSTRTTLSQALNRIDLTSFPNLQPDMKRLSLRLKASFSPGLCWKKLATESGSKLIDETIGVFCDAVELGGDADMVGSLCSQFATTEVMLRARRKVVSSTFSALTIVMHVAVSALMIIILQVLRNFAEVIAAAAVNLQGQEAMRAMQLPMLSFASPLLGTLGTLTCGMVIVLALISAFAIVGADGGHILRGSFYLAILLLLSGICFIIVPPFVDTILKVG
jgi:flagellar protein FlaJ